MDTVINFLKNNYKTIINFIFGLFILYYLIFFLTPKVKMSTEQRFKIDSLNTSINSLQQQQIKLDNNIYEYNQKISQIDNSIDKIKNEKTIIREYYHEKIINVDNLSTSEIDSFFANRYYK